jgi:hypothetical protein
LRIAHAQSIASRTFESGEESVAGGVDFAPVAPLELLPHEPIVLLEQITPPPIAELPGYRHRFHDVREEDSG